MTEQPEPTPADTAPAFTFTDVPFGTLVAGPELRKHTKADIARLAISIDKKGGIFVPLVVRQVVNPTARKGKGELVHEVWAGAGRLAALKLLKTKPAAPVPVVLVDGDEHFAKSVALAENHLRVQMSPLAEADAFTALLDDGHSAEDVAADFGVKPLYVRQRAQLARLVPELRALVGGDKLTLAHAQQASARDPDHQQRIAKALASRGGNLMQYYQWEQLIKADAIKAEFALFELESSGLIVEHDLFDAKDAGWISADQGEEFMQLQRAAASMRLQQMVERGEAASMVLVDRSTGDGRESWSLGQYYYESKRLAPDETLRAIGFLEADGRFIVELRIADGQDAAEDGVRDGVLAKDGDDAQEEEAEDGSLDRFRGERSVPPPDDDAATMHLSQSQKAARDEVQALIACGKLLEDPATAVRAAIFAVLSRGDASSHGAGNLADILLGKDGKAWHGSDAALMVLDAWRRIGPLIGLQGILGPDSANPRDDAMKLRHWFDDTRLAEALKQVEPERLPWLLADALTVTLEPGGRVAAAVALMDDSKAGYLYRMDAYELGKLQQAQLVAQAEAIGRSDLVRKAKGETVRAIVAAGKAAHEADEQAPVFPVFLTRGRR